MNASKLEDKSVEPINSAEQYRRQANLECDAPWLLFQSPADWHDGFVHLHIVYRDFEELYAQAPDGFLIIMESRCQAPWRTCEPNVISHVKRLVRRDMAQVQRERKEVQEGAESVNA